MLWIDGREAALCEPLDRGLEFGDGLFETMAVIDGRVRLLARHLHRLVTGCERLGLVIPDLSALTDELQQAAQRPGIGVLKLVLTRGAGGTGYGSPSAQAARRYLVAGPARRAPLAGGQGVRVSRLPTPLGLQPRLAGLKHLNRLEQVLLRRDVAALGLDEGLVLDLEGRLISGVMSNVFLVLDGQLVTPSLSRCGIDGVMRAAVLEAAPSVGVSVVVRDVLAAECDRAEEIFLTNALIGIWPVTELDGQSLPIGACARRLQEEVARW